MCGIAGIAAKDFTRPVSESVLTAMRDIMTYRGPNDAGNFLSRGIGLASRRLSILDLSEAGHMPMSTSDGRFTIVHNGEVYNFEELKKNLISEGVVFKSHTDTEVLLYLYRRYGPEMLSQLNGMFAFAIWDEQEKELFIARDRLGIKPLYYSIDSEKFNFGSEEKCLIAGGAAFEVDDSGFEELLCFRYRAGEKTPFKGIQRLLPGHFLVWKAGELKIRRWWNLSDRAKNLRDEFRNKNALEWFRETFADSIRLRKISDVPVGVLLSGGLDSSSVAAALKESGHRDLQSFTVSFKNIGYDEAPLADLTAKKFGFTAHKILVTEPELESLIADASWFSDEPVIHGNDTHLLAISKYAKSLVTVLLSGEGSDESLGGYIRYQPLRYPRLLKTALSLAATGLERWLSQDRAKKLARFLELGSLDQFVLFNAVDLFPRDLERWGFSVSPEFSYREGVLAEAKELYPNEPIRQVMYSDQHTFLESILHRNDRMTMGASIECRVPFLDYRLIEGLMAMPTSKLLPGFKTKPLLRRSWATTLPEQVQKHKKWGFGVPWTQHLKTYKPFRHFIEQLPDLDLFQNRISPKKFSSIIQDWSRGNSAYDPLVRQAYFVGVWQQVYRDRCRSFKRAA